MPAYSRRRPRPGSHANTPNGAHNGMVHGEARPLTCEALHGNDRPLQGRPLQGRPLQTRPLQGRALHGRALHGNGRALHGNAGSPLTGRALNGTCATAHFRAVPVQSWRDSSTEFLATQAMRALLRTNGWIWQDGTYTPHSVQQSIRQFANLIDLLCRRQLREADASARQTQAKVLISALLCACSPAPHESPRVVQLARRLSACFVKLCENPLSSSLLGVLRRRYTELVIALLEDDNGTAVLLRPVSQCSDTDGDPGVATPTNM